VLRIAGAAAGAAARGGVAQAPQRINVAEGAPDRRRQIVRRDAARGRGVAREEGGSVLCHLVCHGGVLHRSRGREARVLRDCPRFA